MKHDTFAGYPADSLTLPQQALLTAWDCLSRFQDDLVLIGGLAIRHLTLPPAEGMPGPVTLDVDFGINIAASSGQYETIRDTLSSQGFIWDKKRFKRSFEKLDLHIDLLTDDGRHASGTAMVDDGLPVSVFPGIDRAFKSYRILRIEGKNLVGSRQAHSIRVAEAGPLLILKLNAFGGPVGRKAPKDAHDILYLAMNYLEGTEKAMESFQAEKANANRGMPYALTALEMHFRDADSLGPLSCAAFRMDNRHLDPGRMEESMRIREQCVTLAQELLKV